MQLYVKSQKADLVSYTMPNRDHYCSAGYRSQGVLASYGPEDEEALAILRSKSANFSLVDLSSCSLENKLRARMRGIRRTPTIVLNDGSKIEGISRIRDYMEALHQDDH
jgi:glutaredoxin